LKRSRYPIGIVATLIFVLLFSFLGVDLYLNNKPAQPKIFIGVDVAYGDENLVYNVTKAVAGYANLIILGSLTITKNTTLLTTVCDYLYQNNFYFMVYVGFAKVGYLPPQGPDPSFFQMATQRWGSKFLGTYMFDEVGGKQLDNFAEQPVPAANNNTDAADHYILGVAPYLAIYKGGVYYNIPDMKLFTSDYGLYWYDYLSGYDGIFCEFVENQSRQIAIALDRGAATAQGKSWGAIITFNSCGATGSCLENASELYNDMMLSWQNNAKYIIVFDSPGNFTTQLTPAGILTTDHLAAMKNFWNYALNHPQPAPKQVKTAYVLPTDYGYGFRGPDDNLWGLWPADNLSAKVWNEANSLISTYGTKLDIVYENRTDSIQVSLPYQTLIYWNGTTIQK
jgi:hypothetical protein